jgi:tRNA (guanine37-N1)-methyltransferase
MKITIVTAFPDLFRGFLSTSIIGRAASSGKLDVEVLDLRDFVEGDYRQVDDYAFGAGGMVLMPEPLGKAVESLQGGAKPFVLYPSPQGAVLHQGLVESIAARDHLVFVCGHYEGVDERFIDKYVDLEVSIGDYVLTGGELPTMVIIDAVARLVPGVVGRGQAVEEDSFFRGMLDNPHYTRPANWKGQDVPDVLLSGNHAGIVKWRRRQSVIRTLRRRPDVVGRAPIGPYMSHGAYVCLLHHPVLDKEGNETLGAVTGFDLHDLSRAAMTYGLDKVLVVTPSSEQRQLVRKIADHWITGQGAQRNPERGEAMALLKSFPSLKRARDWVFSREKREPLVIGTSARTHPLSVHWLELKRRALEEDLPLLFVFGTSWGLPDRVLDSCDTVLHPIRGGKGDFNHLSVRSAATVVLDRFFGWR